MAPKPLSSTQPGSQKKPKSSTTKTRTVKLDGERGPSSSAPSKTTRLDPLTAFSRSALTFSSINSKSATPPDSLTASKGKEQTASNKMGKMKAKFHSPSNAIDDLLWVDRYEPTTEAELAVHVRKVEDVRRWFTEAFDGGPSGKLKKYRRILALTGPAGTGKTATVRVLAKEMGFELLEWKNTITESTSSVFPDRSEKTYQPEGDHDKFHHSPSVDYESLFTKFEAFLARASTCQNVFVGSSTSRITSNRRIILLEDIPNILHPKTQAQFHEALHSLISTQTSDPVPVVIVVSDAGVRGETIDDQWDRNAWHQHKAQVVDVRTVISKDLLGGPYVTEISFNPIAPTLLRKALQAMVNTHFSSISNSSTGPPSKEVLNIIVESSNGDIRSAIMALQFACIIEIPSSWKKGSQQIVLDAVTRREQSLALFHLLGKILYNKRKGDPLSASLSAKDVQKERELDSALKDPSKLPHHLSHHVRRTSRVDVDLVYANSPVDTSLFSLYIHQNYPSFCNQIEECEGVSDWLSWIDSSGGEMWYQANPHQFHLLTLGTMHSLPSPVPRRSQKYHKPEFFSFLQQEKDAWDGVRNTRDWLTESQVSREDSGWRAGGWSRNDVVLELGGILRAKDAFLEPKSKPPPIHRRFSQMLFTRTAGLVRSQQLNEGYIATEQELHEHQDQAHPVFLSQSNTKEEDKGGWLESDDIDEF